MQPSGDWRFLPGIPVDGDSLTLSVTEITRFEVVDVQPRYRLIAVPEGWDDVSQLSGRTIYHLLKPGGVLYAGFAGRDGFGKT